MRILVSACLLGKNCRYDKGNCFNEFVVSLEKEHTLIPVCAEIEGGLSCPRSPAEILGDRVISKDKSDVTEQFNLGAQRVLAVAKSNNADFAILKEYSPSCGSQNVYDGSHSGKIRSGVGVTTALLKVNGFNVFNETQTEQILAVLKGEK